MDGHVPPKVIIVVPRYLPLLGGMERQVHLLAEEFARRAWRVVIITELLDASPRMEDNGRVRVIRVGSRRNRPDPPVGPRGLMEQLRSLVGIAYHILSNRDGVQLGIVRMFTMPSVVVGGLKRLRLLCFATIVSAESGGERDDIVLFSEVKGQPILRAALAGNDYFNALCSLNARHLGDLGIDPEVILSIPNGIAFSKWKAEMPATTVRRLLYFGRLDAAKGILDLADAFSAARAFHPELRLDYIGDGPAADALDARIAALDLSAVVQRHSSVAYDDLPAVVRAYDCVVLPSYSEGLPLSVLEAAAAGRHLIVSDVADLRSILGDSARFFSPGDIDGLEAAIREMANQSSASTSAEVVSPFDIAKTVDQYELCAVRQSR